jgi:DNA-directed RNA polymerase subunit N (RpoN/RPB10)
LEEAATVWYRLLLHLCIAAGEQQVQRLYARLSEDSPSEDVFRQAGFAVYCCERIFSRSPRHQLTEASDSTAARQLSARMQPVHADDHWHLQRLWTRATPRLVLHAEGFNGSHGDSQPMDLPISGLERGFVCRSDKGEMQGCLQLLSRPRGVWLRLLSSPGASDAAVEMLDHALAVLHDHPPRPIYCAVREYEGGVQSVLEDRGFVHVENHSLLVKHTTVRVREPRRQLVPSLEKRAEAAPTVSGSKAGEA